MAKDNAMLRLVDIVKVYQAGGNSVRAVDGVSLNFRKNEFVSILGPSGSGKTTLLNIIGGLDHYTSGDLVIAGKSTKQYKDRDWDKYRNLRVGFIFQSYNLIPHQNVLSNVELALTISGVGKEERKQRAIEALNKVGLHDQIYKKPNQLSGGQCQRGAIARALVNNPEILLADEPTGALDTKTSKQIMDLIAEIAKDRLVIMVTHNPELAEEYSSRIIRLLDGKISDDSNPLEAEEDYVEEEKVTKAKMGLLTAGKLSFKNLVSKRKRSILVAIASSIGIIGVSTVLSVSYGITNYVNSMQDDMLSSYPLEIAEQSLDVSGLMSGLSNSEKAELAKFDVSTELGMSSMIEYLMDKYSDFTKLSSNDINQNLVDYVSDIPSEDLAAVSYNYGIDVTNNIFTNWTSSGRFSDTIELENSEKKWVSLNGLTQRYISELNTVNGFSSYASYVNLFTNFMKEMPGDETYTLSQYDLLGNSTFANNENEIMLVVSKDSTITDLMLGQLGIYNHDEFISIGQRAVEIYKKGSSSDGSDWGLKRKLEELKGYTQEDYNRDIEVLNTKYPYRRVLNYDELIGREFYYLPHSALWNYEKVSDDTLMEGNILLYNSNKIYNLRYDSSYVSFGYDILTGDEIDLLTPSNSKKVTFARKASTNRDSNTFFDSTVTTKITDLLTYWTEIDSLSSLKPTGRVIDVRSANKAVTFITFDLSNPLSPSVVSAESFVEGLDGAKVVLEATETAVVNAYCYQVNNQDVASNPKAVKMKISGILRAKESTNFGSLSRGVYYTKALSKRYMDDAKSQEAAILHNEINGLISSFNNGSALTNTFKAYCKFSFVDYSDEQNPFVDTSGYAFALNGDLSNSMASLFSSFLGSASSESTNKVYLRALSGQKATADVNKLKYVFEDLPQEIDIYPKDFASKDNVTKYLDKWNQDGSVMVKGVEIKRSERTDVTYTDTVAIIINVINSLITIVTSALVAFTSLSLVVSCFMIAVITYISVVERIKEIGVIRSLGGRKKDVSRLFTAENLITGICLIINIVVSFFGAPAIAMLPWWIAIIMVALAVVLNVISGFIPSRNAARQDPVEALRSE